MARLIIQIGDSLLSHVREHAAQTNRSKADVVRDSLQLHEYLMHKVSAGKQVVIHDPLSGETTLVDLTDF